MIFPIGDDQVEGGHKPIFAYSFLAINILAFVIPWFAYGPNYHSFVTEFGSLPGEITNGIDLHTLISSMFMHGGWMHLVGNMLFLWVFGDNIEATVGSFNFLLFYFIGGLFASAGHIISDPDSMIPTVGASGAIAAVLGAYLVMFPKSQIKMLFLLGMRTFKIPAMLFLGFWIAQQLWSGFTTSTEGGGTAWWAHIGGFIFGVIAGYFTGGAKLGKDLFKKKKDYV